MKGRGRTEEFYNLYRREQGSPSKKRGERFVGAHWGSKGQHDAMGGRRAGEEAMEGRESMDCSV
jgi:hypothetical protein